MNEIARTDKSDLAQSKPIRVCEYCGHILNPLLYFCPACAKPYRNPDALLPRKIERYYSDGDKIKMKAPNVWTMFWVYFGSILATHIACWLVMGDKDEAYIAPALFFSSAVLFIITCVYTIKYWSIVWPQFSLLGLFRWQGLMGILAIGPMLLINFGIMKLVQASGAMQFDLNEELTKAGIDMAGQIILIAVLPALIEEIAFRGILQKWLMNALTPFKAIVLSSALFTALHFSAFAVPYLFVLGMLLGWTAWKSKSLLPAMIMHGIHNAVVIVYF